MIPLTSEALECSDHQKQWKAGEIYLKKSVSLKLCFGLDANILCEINISKYMCFLEEIVFRRSHDPLAKFCTFLWRHCAVEADFYCCCFLLLQYSSPHRVSSTFLFHRIWCFSCSYMFYQVFSILGCWNVFWNVKLELREGHALERWILGGRGRGNAEEITAVTLVNMYSGFLKRFC